MALDRNAQRALDRFNKAKAERAKPRRPGTVLQIATQAIHRVAKASDVDTSKADPDCKRCLGTGSLGTRVIPGNRGCEPTKIPLICRCVSAGGGVKPMPTLKPPKP